MKYLFVFISITYVTSLAYADKIRSRVTIAHSSGNKAKIEFEAMLGEHVFTNVFANKFGEELGISKYITFDRKDVEVYDNHGVVSEKVQNCWFLRPSKYECETVSQEREWAVQDH